MPSEEFRASASSLLIKIRSSRGGSEDRRASDPAGAAPASAPDEIP